MVMMTIAMMIVWDDIAAIELNKHNNERNQRDTQIRVTTRINKQELRECFSNYGVRRKWQTVAGGLSSQQLPPLGSLDVSACSSFKLFENVTQNTDNVDNKAAVRLS